MVPKSPLTEVPKSCCLLSTENFVVRSTENCMRCGVEYRASRDSVVAAVGRRKLAPARKREAKVEGATDELPPFEHLNR
jgi:hypothetical protein